MILLHLLGYVLIFLPILMWWVFNRYLPHPGLYAGFIVLSVCTGFGLLSL